MNYNYYQDMHKMRLEKIKSIINADKFNKYIYQKTKTLYKLKEKSILEAKRYEPFDEDYFKNLLMDYFPDPLAMYILELDNLRLICKTLSYKWHIKGTINNYIKNYNYNFEKDCREILEIIEIEPKATYWEIVSETNTYNVELALEYLINDNIIVRTDSMENEYGKDNSYWEILKEL